MNFSHTLLDGQDTVRTLAADTGNANTTFVDAEANEQGVRYTYQVRAIRGEEESLACSVMATRSNVSAGASSL